MKRLENKWAEVIVISVFTMVFLSSCGIQFGNYDRWKEVHGKPKCSNEIKEVEKSIIELRYYVNEDVYNGNLSEEVYEFYTKELYKIEQSINEINKELMYTSEYSCQNCDEVD